MLTHQELQRAKLEIVRDGFAIVKGVYSPDEANQMRGAALAALMSSSPDREYKAGGRVQLVSKGEVSFPALLFWPSLVSPYLNKVRTDPRLAGLVAGLIGPNVKQLNNQLYFRVPGDSDSFAWHQDVMFRDNDAYTGVTESYIQTTIAIDRIDEDNAPVEFIVGSHRLGNLKLMKKGDPDFRNFERENLPPELVKLPVRKALANPGDMILWSLLAVHGSPPNKSGVSRMTYMSGFCDSQHSRDWPDYLVDGNVVATADNTRIPIGKP